MKIYNKITLGWNEETQRYDDVIYEDSFQYGGEILALGPQDGVMCNCIVGSHWTDDIYGCGNPTWTCEEIGTTDDCPDGYPSTWVQPGEDEILGQCTPPDGGEGGGTSCDDDVQCHEWFSDDYFCIDSECQYQEPGCMDPAADNYNANAQYDPMGYYGSCVYTPVPDVPSEVTVDDTATVTIDASNSTDIDDPLNTLIFTWAVTGPGMIQPSSSNDCTNCIGHYSYYDADVDLSTYSWEDLMLVGETETATIQVTVTDPGGLSDTATVNVTINGTGTVVTPSVVYEASLELDTTVSTSAMLQPESITNPNELPITFYNVDADEVRSVSDGGFGGRPPIIGSRVPGKQWMRPSGVSFSDYIQVHNPETGDYEIEVLDSEFYGTLTFYTAWSVPAVGNLMNVGAPGTDQGICAMDNDVTCTANYNCPPPANLNQCLHKIQDSDGNEVVGTEDFQAARINISWDNQGGHLHQHIIDGKKGAPEGTIVATAAGGSNLDLFINEYIIELGGDSKELISPFGYAIQDRDNNSTYEIEIELIEGVGMDRDASRGLVYGPTDYVPNVGLDYTFEQNGQYEIRISASDVWDNPGTVKLNVLISGVVQSTSSVLGSYSPHQGIDIDPTAYSAIAPTTTACIPQIPCGQSLGDHDPSTEATCTAPWGYTIPATTGCTGTGYVDCNPFYNDTQCLEPCSFMASGYLNLGACAGGVMYCADASSENQCTNMTNMEGSANCSWGDIPEAAFVFEEDFCQWQEADCIDVRDGYYPDDFTTLDALDTDPRQRLGLYYWNEIQSGLTSWGEVISTDPRLGGLPKPYNVGEYTPHLSHTFIPDVDVRTAYGLEESQDAPLFKYYDRDIQFDQYESAVAPGTVQLSFYPRMGGRNICPGGTGPDIHKMISPFSSFKPLYRDELGTLNRDKFLIVALDWEDGSAIEFNHEPFHIDSGVMIHSYKKSGIYRITGYMVRMNDTFSYDEPNEDDDSVQEFIKFELYISINKRIGFEDDFKLLGGDDYTYIPYSETTPVISGISESSLYHKTIARAVGYIGESRLDIEFPGQGELARAEYALANMNEDLSGYAEIDNYTGSFADTGATDPGAPIYTNQYPLRGELGDWVGNIDLAQARVFMRPMQMYEMLGFPCDEASEINIINYTDAPAGTTTGWGRSDWGGGTSSAIIWSDITTPWNAPGVTIQGDTINNTDNILIQRYIPLISLQGGDTFTLHYKYKVEGEGDPTAGIYVHYNDGTNPSATMFYTNSYPDVIEDLGDGWFWGKHIFTLPDTPDADSQGDLCDGELCQWGDENYIRVLLRDGNVPLGEQVSFSEPMLERGDTVHEYVYYENPLMIGECEEAHAGNPELAQYWQNIIPEDWNIYCDRDGVTCGDDGSIDIVDETQAWDDGTDQYYYPVLPKLTQDGAWDVDNLQGDRVPFGTPGRAWDQDDDFAPTTATDLQYKSLIIDLDFSKVKQKSLSDRSGNQNAGMLIGDYAIQYDEKRYAVGKKQSIKPVIRKKHQRKAY